MHFIITTVHGTFASRAKWPQVDSTLSTCPKQRLPGVVEIRPYRWSGKNSFPAREAAARDLREHVRNVAEEHPSANHFIVAHSHGGNVALLAAGDESVKALVAGIVCLSTPFLQAWPRQLGTARIVSAGMGVVVFLGALFGLAWQHWVGPLSWGLVGGIVVLTIPINSMLAKAALRIADSRHWSLPDFNPRHMLILRTAGDEASATLGAALKTGSECLLTWAPT